MGRKEVYESLVEHVQNEIPGFRIAYKDEATWRKDWKLKISQLVVERFNDKFMVSYTSTFYPVVYFPSREFVEENYTRAFRILAHEYVHLWDEQKTLMRRVWFPASYLMPQLFGLLGFLAFGAFWNLWFLLALLAFGFFAPIRSPWRSHWEMRGYSMNLSNEFRIHGKISNRVRDRIVDIFTLVGTYYRMWPDRDAVRKEVDVRADLIRVGDFLGVEEDSEPFREVQEIWLRTSK